jgi:hypothetical protein
VTKLDLQSSLMIVVSFLCRACIGRTELVWRFKGCSGIDIQSAPIILRLSARPYVPLPIGVAQQTTVIEFSRLDYQVPVQPAPAVVPGGFDILGVVRNLLLPYISFSSWGPVFSTSQPTCSVVLDSLDGLPAVNIECFPLF